MTNDETIDAVNRWLDVMVVGLNLCPFANAARRRKVVRIVATDESMPEACLQELAIEAHRLVEADADATTLLVLPTGFAEFDDYLDLLAVGQALLDDLGFEGVLQLASFHPDYQFDGTEATDVSNWTNRAPFPILHLLKEESVARAVDAHMDPDGIPERNIERLEALGLEGVLKLMAQPAPRIGR